MEEKPEEEKIRVHEDIFKFLEGADKSFNAIDKNQTHFLKMGREWTKRRAKSTPKLTVDLALGKVMKKTKP